MGIRGCSPRSRSARHPAITRAGSRGKGRDSAPTRRYPPREAGVRNWGNRVDAGRIGATLRRCGGHESSGARGERWGGDDPGDRLGGSCGYGGVARGPRSSCCADGRRAGRKRPPEEVGV